MAQVLPATPPLGSRSSSPFLDRSPLRHASIPAASYTRQAASYPDSKSYNYYDQTHLESSSESSSGTSSPHYDNKSSDSTTPSSISLDPREEDDDDDEEDEDDGLCFPSYGDRRPDSSLSSDSTPTVSGADAHEASPPVTPQNSTGPGSPTLKPADDISAYEEPTRQVDYLSHNWNEEDVSASWRHIVSSRKTFGQRSRLENASWRTWTKSKYRLKTVEPERLNWMKDCDVTWLYGPLQEAHQINRHWDIDAKIKRKGPKPDTHIVKNDSFLKKPILKKRSVSEVMLQKSLSSSSLVRQAATAVQAQRLRRRGSHDRPRLARSTSEGARESDYPGIAETLCIPSELSSEVSSGSRSPENGKRHIQFNDTVEQCIAVDFKSGDGDMAANWARAEAMSTSSSEEDLIMMKQKPIRRGSTSVSASRRNSIGQESKGIAILPPTKLKYHHDEPYCPGHPDRPGTPGSSSGRLSHSVSQETIRPSNPSTNFLLDDDDDDMSWDPSGAFGAPMNKQRSPTLTDDVNDVPSGLRRTPSGMFMPFDAEEDEVHGNAGMFGRVVNTVNTARDIFSVIYNVGWRS